MTLEAEYRIKLPGMRDSQKSTHEKNPVDLSPSPSVFSGSVRGLTENGEREKKKRKTGKKG